MRVVLDTNILISALLVQSGVPGTIYRAWAEGSFTFLTCQAQIEEPLFPEVRAKVLAATFGQPDREWYFTELARSLETQPSSLQRELKA